MTDAQGEVVATYTYEAFGNLIESTGNVENSYLFAREQRDENLGQYYLRQRYYDSELGRFTRRDTYEGKIGEPISLHKYLYANDNPTNYRDPSGNFSLSETSTINTIISTLVGIVAVEALLPNPVQAPTDSGDITEPSPYKIFLEIAVGAGAGIVASTVLARVFSSAIDDVVLTIPGSVGADAAPITITSAVKYNPYAIRLAQNLSDDAQREVNSLVAQLLKGNPNPGLGTKSLGDNFFEFRGRNAGRVIVKKISETRYDIVGKFQGHKLGDKANSDIINRLIKDYQQLGQ